ncbi:hypothetical protein [Pseudomonas sp.]|jgi:hypothetical protein|uniref:hypothetical protein n=1 Tax=Pseudomonas sp. TaxID=306 RepID=UPI0026141F5E|nr:hypothetical protein [Pseudomonas sp.]
MSYDEKAVWNLTEPLEKPDFQGLLPYMDDFSFMEALEEHMCRQESSSEMACINIDVR